MTRERKLQIFYYIGLFLTLAGAIDPLEGSVVVAAGAIILAVVTHKYGDPQARWYKVAAILIAIGVIALWVLSGFGGFGGETGRPMRWGITILPYPIGWLMILGLLFIRLFVRRDQP